MCCAQSKEEIGAAGLRKRHSDLPPAARTPPARIVEICNREMDSGAEEEGEEGEEEDAGAPSPQVRQHS
jgi:hypothetical protein